MRGDTRIWAAGAIYAVGQVNFLFDRSQRPHMTADRLAACLGVVKTTMANKAALINKTLNLGVFEPDLTRPAMLEQHPLAWLVEVDGLIVDARMLPFELQDEARRRGPIPDLDHTAPHDHDGTAERARCKHRRPHRRSRQPARADRGRVPPLAGAHPIASAAPVSLPRLVRERGATPAHPRSAPAYQLHGTP